MNKYEFKHRSLNTNPLHYFRKHVLIKFAKEIEKQFQMLIGEEGRKVIEKGEHVYLTGVRLSGKSLYQGENEDE